MPVILVNPLDETPRPQAKPAPRLDTLAGRRVALLDISKPGGSVFLDFIEQTLKSRFAVAGVSRYRKATYTKPASAPLLQQIRDGEPHAVIEALAD